MADPKTAGGTPQTPTATSQQQAAGKKTEKAAPDPELALMSRITRALQKLEPTAQRRIGRYLADRWGEEKPK